MNGWSYHQFLVSHEVGGAALVGLHVADHLRRSRQRCQVWLPGPGPAEQEAGRLGLPTAGYDSEALLSRSKVRAAWGNWRLARRLRRDGPGLVHVHSPYHYAAVRWGLRWARVKRVVHIHLDFGLEGLQWALRTPPELIVTCARSLVDGVRKALPPAAQQRQRVEAVPNAVDTDRFAPGDKGKAKEYVGAPGDLPLALMLANLAPHKGQETAIRAVALLKQRRVDVACWLAGVERGGEESFTARLRGLIGELGVGDRVRLLGQRRDAPDLLRAADFFLLPSTSEGLPLSVLEAQASKVPVLAAPTAGIPDVVRDGETGFLIAADDAVGYADRLQTLLTRPELARLVAETAHAQIVAEHSWPAYCRRIQELYQEILNGNGAGPSH
ncbi:MAG: glycosyltransferase family 4 protein [Gemmataceae bacterium]|nr:glycosyltransferase family 4 protein [Gemmataceae bacterium]